MAILAGAVARRIAGGPPGGSEGFLLPFVILAALLISVGTLALVNRSGMGFMGAVFHGLSFDAQEAAEIGMNRIISELNRKENRGLLRSKGSPVETALWTSADAGTVHNSRCPDTPNSPDLATNPSIGYPAGSSAPTTYNSVYVRNDGTISSSAAGATRAYRLVSVTRRPEAELTIFQAMAAPAGTVTLEVEGRALRSDGSTSAVTTLRRTFQLVPRCCGASFGGAHGNVNYARPASDSTAYVCLPDSMMGLGLLGGTGSTTGTFTIRGSDDFYTDSGQIISTVYCLADINGTCSTVVTGNVDVTIDIINPRPTNFPPAKIYPGANTTTPAPAVLSAPNTTNTSAFTYCIDSVSHCRTWAINADASTVPSNCLQTSTETHCYFSKLNYSNSDLFFLTNTRKLRLYFVSSGVIVDGGNGNNGLHHCNTVGLVSGSYMCTGDAPSAADLAVFGCNSCGSQTYSWKGTPDVINAFVYIPNGVAVLSGNSSFKGVLWTNAIVSNGNVNWTVPGAGLRDVMDYMGLLSGKSMTPTANPLLFDYVARATSAFRWVNQ
jgi:hypothetical protein